MTALPRAFAAAGVDYGQWCALMRAHTLVSLSALRGVHGRRMQRRAWRELAGMLVAFQLVGAVIAAAVFLVRDTFMAGTVLTTAIGLMAAMVVTGQRPSVFAPEDYEIVGFRPIATRTYFAARVSGFFAQVLGVAALCSALPLLALVLRADGTLGLGLAAGGTLVVTCLAVTGAIFATYSLLVRILPPQRVTHAVALLQHGLPMAAVFVAIPLPALYFAFSDVASPRSLVLPDAWWVLVWPFTWFAAAIEIARGTAGPVHWAGVAAGLLTLAGTLWPVRAVLLDEYSAHVTRLAHARSSDGSPGYAWPFLRKGRRAVLLLLWAELRSNVTQQTSIAFNLAMSLAFMGIVLSTMGLPENPFQAGRGTTGGFSLLVFLLVFVQVPLLDRGVFSSDAAEASWIYYTTSSPAADLVMAGRDISAVLISLPLLGVALPLLAYAFGSVGAAAVMAFFLVVIAYLCIQLSVALRPRLPLSVQQLPGQPGFQPAAGFLTALVPTLFGLHLFLAVLALGVQSAVRTLVAAALLLALIPVLNAWTRRRVARALPRYLEA